MKYLILYEAFESRILSSTLGFLKDKVEKQNFLNILKNICNGIDYPYSKLSDDFFEYLPFKKALEKNDMTGDDPCDATSEKAFPDYPVKGEVCQGGKIKRMWGSRSREVVCPVCNGTGTKPKKQELKLLKFWFDKDGKYITTTAVDGLVSPSRGEGLMNTSKSNIKTIFSNKIEDYNIVKRDLSLTEIKNLPLGSLVYFENRNNDSGVGYIWKYRDSTYILQNFAEGSWAGGEWSHIAPYSWVVSSNDDFRQVNSLKLKDESEREKDLEEVDPYTWNARANIRGSKPSITSGSIYSEVKPAHFAIILDLGKLKSSGYKTKGEIRLDRSEIKSGATALLSDEQIKKQNIQRYLDQLVTMSDITTDISNVSRVVKRMLGGNKLLFLIMGDRSRYHQDFTEIISLYMNFMKSNHEREYYVNRLKELISNKYKIISDRNLILSNNIDLLYKRINSDTDTDESTKEKLTLILDETIRLSKMVYDKFSKIEVETIEDLEIISSKILSIRNLLMNDRYPFYYLYYFWGYSSQSFEHLYYYMTGHYYMVDNFDKIISSFPMMERLLNKI